MIDEIAFRHESDRALEALKQALIRAEEDGGFEAEEKNGVLNVLFEDGSADAIHRAEIPAPGSDRLENRTRLIPKIIHQTYKNSSIPEIWQAGQQSCIDLHEDYEYKVTYTAIWELRMQS